MNSVIRPAMSRRRCVRTKIREKWLQWQIHLFLLMLLKHALCSTDISSHIIPQRQKKFIERRMEKTSEVDVNNCFSAISIFGGSVDSLLDEDEYVSVVNHISGGQYKKFHFSELPTNIKSKYKTFSNESSGINVEGIRPNSNATKQQKDILQRFCVELDKAIDIALHDTPTVAPSDISAFATPMPTEASIVEKVPARSPPSKAMSRPSYGRTRSAFRRNIPPLGFANTSPTQAPSTEKPTFRYTNMPSVANISHVSDGSTEGVTKAPLSPTEKVTQMPLAATTDIPSAIPTLSPTKRPSKTPTTPPSDWPTMTPTVDPTKEPTPVPSGKPEQSPTYPPSKSPVGTAAPALKGVNFLGNLSFSISNSIYLDEDHLKSGKRRYDLNLAFNNLAEKVYERNFSRRLLGIDRSRKLRVQFAYGKVEEIKNESCKNKVPTGTLCALCHASFAINVVDERQITVDSRILSMTKDLTEAIKNGELQDELDMITPTTPLRIEEGTVRKRDKPKPLKTEIEISKETMAVIIVCIVVGIPLLCCVSIRCCKCFRCCCWRKKAEKQTKPELKECAPPKKEKNGWFWTKTGKKVVPEPQESAPPEKKKKGWFW